MNIKKWKLVSLYLKNTTTYDKFTMYIWGLYTPQTKLMLAQITNMKGWKKDMQIVTKKRWVGFTNIWTK